jgi:hypothetical protein
MIIHTKIDRAFPLSFIDADNLLYYKFGNIYKLNFETKTKELIASFNFSFKHNILSRIVLISRLLRLNARLGFKMDDDNYIVVRDRKLHEINIERKTISSGYILPRGNRPLNIVNVSVAGFEDTCYFGEYFSNYDYSHVSIYKRIKEDTWGVAYTFKKGEINHIHNIIPDKANKCIWILTGDSGNAAAIWKAKNNFNDVKLIVSGLQAYRSCVALPYNNNFYYLTDIPMETNYLINLYSENDIHQMQKLYEINGSVIYSYRMDDELFFSSVVEGSETKKILVKRIFDFRKGPGIKTHECFLYKFSAASGELILLTREKKDLLPFRLFQYGSIIFPSGNVRSKYLPVFHIGIKGKDLSLVIYKL